MKLRPATIGRLAAGSMILASALGTTAAQAAVVRGHIIEAPSFNGNCWSGTDGWGDGHWAWGACTGYGTFRLRASCTWGQNKTSQPVTVNGGNSRVDVECPFGTKVVSTYIES